MREFRGGKWKPLWENDVFEIHVLLSVVRSDRMRLVVHWVPPAVLLPSWPTASPFAWVKALRYPLVTLLRSLLVLKQHSSFSHRKTQDFSIFQRFWNQKGSIGRVFPKSGLSIFCNVATDFVWIQLTFLGCFFWKLQGCFLACNFLDQNNQHKLLFAEESMVRTSSLTLKAGSCSFRICAGSASLLQTKNLPFRFGEKMSFLFQRCVKSLECIYPTPRQGCLHRDQRFPSQSSQGNVVSGVPKQFFCPTTNTKHG